MLDPILLPLAIAAAIGLAIGTERRWRGFAGSLPFHIAPALVGAFLVTRQPALTRLIWFLPLQALLWLIVIAIVCMWAAERTPSTSGEFRGSGGLGLSWTLAFLLGAACAFGAWVLVGTACGALIVFGMRTPRRITTAPSVVAAKPVEESRRGETVGGADVDIDLERVNSEAGRAPEPTIDGPLVKTSREKPLLERPAA